MELNNNHQKDSMNEKRKRALELLEDWLRNFENEEGSSLSREETSDKNKSNE